MDHDVSEEDKNEGSSSTINIADFIPLYPAINEDTFEADISRKKEYSELSLSPTESKPPRGGLLKQQTFIKRYISPFTLYNRILLFHQLGSGKTCSAVAVAENFLRFYGLRKKNAPLVLVKGPSIEDNFRK